ncbi:MAG: TldD/PmbA family protein [Pseudomonadota bacterium]
MKNQIEQLISYFPGDYVEAAVQHKMVNSFSLLNGKGDGTDFSGTKTSARVTLYRGGQRLHLPIREINGRISFSDLKDKIFNSHFDNKFDVYYNKNGFQRLQKKSKNILRDKEAFYLTKCKLPFNSINNNTKREIFADRLIKCDRCKPSFVDLIIFYQDSMTETCYYNSNNFYHNRVDSMIEFSGFLKYERKLYPIFSHNEMAGLEVLVDYVFGNGFEEKIEMIKVFKNAWATKIKSGIYNVILDPTLGAGLIHEAFGHTCEADISFSKNVKGRRELFAKFRNEDITIADDPTIAEKGFVYIDDEGVMAKKKYLVEKGVLKSCMHSIFTATNNNSEVMGNGRTSDASQIPIPRMTNTYIEPKNISLTEMFSSLDNGLYLKGNIGGGKTNGRKFSLNVEQGYIVKKGKITGSPISNLVIKGDCFATINNIVKIGNDLTFVKGFGGCSKKGQNNLPVSGGSPHLMVKNVFVTHVES